MTIKPWVKQLKFVNNGKVQLSGGIVKRHLAHHRCKTPVIMKGNSIYCDKCKVIPPIKDTGRWSYLNKKFLKIRDISIGVALVDNIDNPIILIDLEYRRRHKNAI